MDHFKEVNDVYGHVMGDNVLKMLGGFLKEQFREQDVIGRIGGDEFVILLCNIGSRENMESRIKKLHEKLREIRMEVSASKHGVVQNSRIPAIMPTSLFEALFSIPS